MFKWKACAWAFAVILVVLAPLHVLGFHEPDRDIEAVFLVGITVVWCICDGVSLIVARLDATHD